MTAWGVPSVEQRSRGRCYSGGRASHHHGGGPGEFRDEAACRRQLPLWAWQRPGPRTCVFDIEHENPPLRDCCCPDVRAQPRRASEDHHRGASAPKADLRALLAILPLAARAVGHTRAAVAVAASRHPLEASDPIN
jgi:hypothetical protein